MTVDLTKLQLHSANTTDKIPVYSTVSDGYGHLANLASTIPASTDPSGDAQNYFGAITNPYGKRCLTTLSWSVDGVNFYPQNHALWYYNSTFGEYLIQAVGYAGCSDDSIYLGVATQYNESQTITWQFAIDSPT